jgi:hypothetical protein
LTTSALNDRQRLVLSAIQRLDAEAGASDDPVRQSARLLGWTAQAIGYEAQVPRVWRHGNGAVKGSWSGYVDPGLTITATLRALKRRGLIRSFSAQRHRYVAAYALTPAGRATTTEGEPHVDS